MIGGIDQRPDFEPPVNPAWSRPWWRRLLAWLGVDIMTRAQWHALCAQYDREGRTFLWGNRSRRVICYRLRGRVRFTWIG